MGEVGDDKEVEEVTDMFADLTKKVRNYLRLAAVCTKLTLR